MTEPTNPTPYPETSRLGRAWVRYEATRAAHDAARGEAGRLSEDLRQVEDRWTNAALDNITPADFAALTAQRELLMRASNRARQAAGYAEAHHLTARHEWATANQSYMTLCAEADRLERHGRTAELVRVRASIAALTGTAA